MFKSKAVVKVHLKERLHFKNFQCNILNVYQIHKIHKITHQRYIYNMFTSAKKICYGNWITKYIKLPTNGILFRYGVTSVKMIWLHSMTTERFQTPFKRHSSRSYTVRNLICVVEFTRTYKTFSLTTYIFRNLVVFLQPA